MLDLKDIKERLEEMRRLRALHVAAVAKTATTGAEIMQADEPGAYEVDVAALIAEVERLRGVMGDLGCSVEKVRDACLTLRRMTDDERSD